MASLTKTLCLSVAVTVAALAAPNLGRADASPAGADSVQSAYESGTREQLGSTPDLEDYLRVAAANNPRLRAAFYDWKRAYELSGHAGALPNPMLTYSYFLESVETRVGPQNQRISLRQAFPWFGTLGAKEERATASSRSAWQRFQAEKLALFYRVKAAYLDYYYLGREIDITRENLELLRFWESVVRAKYRVALQDHPDVIKAQVELGKLEDRVETLLQEKEPAASRLRAALDLPTGTALPIPSDIHVDESEIGRDTVLALSMERNPNLRALQHTIESTRANARVANKSSWPNFVVGLDYIETGPAMSAGVPESGKDPFMVSVGVSLPIWFGANRARKQEAEASMLQAQNRYADQRNQVAKMVDRTLFEHNDALRKVRLYRDGLVPKAQQSLNATYTAYQAGKMDFLSVLDAQRQLLDFQLKFERSLATLAIKRAELEMVAGSDLVAAEE